MNKGRLTRFYMRYIIKVLRKITNKYMNQEILKQIKAPNGRCYYSCIQYLKKLSKQERKDYKIIEGKADGYLHYWLEKDSEILDIHYAIIGEEAQDYKKEKEYSYDQIQQAIDKSSYEELQYEMLGQGRIDNANGSSKLIKLYHINL